MVIPPKDILLNVIVSVISIIFSSNSLPIKELLIGRNFVRYHKVGTQQLQFSCYVPMAAGKNCFLKFRYIGDMLAWIHQAMATERELLQALLKLCSADGNKLCKMKL